MQTFTTPQTAAAESTVLIVARDIALADRLKGWLEQTGEWLAARETRTANALTQINGESAAVVVVCVESATDDNAELCRRIKADNSAAQIALLAVAGDEATAAELFAVAPDALLVDENLTEFEFVSAARTLRRLQQRENGAAMAEKLDEREHLIAAINDAAPNLIMLFDFANRRLFYVNRRVEQILGFAPAELTGSSSSQIIERIHPEDLARVNRHVSQLIEKGNHEILENEFRCQHKNGEWRTLRVRDMVFKRAPETDAAQMILSVADDVTEARRHELALRESEQERDALLERAEEARREAEAATRAKDEFLAVLSHELRTPLNAMYGWVRMLAAGNLDEAGQKRAVEVIERNVEVQTKLIEDILDISRIVAGKIKLEPRPLDLVALLKTVVETARPNAEQKNLQIVTDFAPERLSVIADAERLQQVFSNLINNAVKFTTKNGRITIKLTADAEQARVTVSDTGIGIAPDLLPFVFDRFRQADGAPNRRSAGLGLGLAIVKNLVELHGGQVQAASDGEGAGSTFTVQLPLKAREIAQL